MCVDVAQQTQLFLSLSLLYLRSCSDRKSETEGYDIYSCNSIYLYTLFFQGFQILLDPDLGA